MRVYETLLFAVPQMCGYAASNGEINALKPGSGFP